MTIQQFTPSTLFAPNGHRIVRHREFDAPLDAPAYLLMDHDNFMAWYCPVCAADMVHVLGEMLLEPHFEDRLIEQLCGTCRRPWTADEIHAAQESLRYPKTDRGAPRFGSLLEPWEVREIERHNARLDRNGRQNGNDNGRTRQNGHGGHTGHRNGDGRRHSANGIANEDVRKFAERMAFLRACLVDKDEDSLTRIALSAPTVIGRRLANEELLRRAHARGEFSIQWGV